MARKNSKRGFAAMDPKKQRQIASKGGRASHGVGRVSSSNRTSSNGRSVSARSLNGRSSSRSTRMS